MSPYYKLTNFFLTMHSEIEEMSARQTLGGA